MSEIKFANTIMDGCLECDAAPYEPCRPECSQAVTS